MNPPRAPSVANAPSPRTLPPNLYVGRTPHRGAATIPHSTGAVGRATSARPRGRGGGRQLHERRGGGRCGGNKATHVRGAQRRVRVAAPAPSAAEGSPERSEGPRMQAASTAPAPRPDRSRAGPGGGNDAMVGGFRRSYGRLRLTGEPEESRGLARARYGRLATQMPLPTRTSAANTAGVSGSPRISAPASTPITGVRKENEDRRVAGYSRTSQNQAR
jgi:hypothetical protein